MTAISRFDISIASFAAGVARRVIRPKEADYEHTGAFFSPWSTARRQ